MRQLETLNDAHNQRHYQTTWPTQKFNIKTALCADTGEWADGIQLLPAATNLCYITGNNIEVITPKTGENEVKSETNVTTVAICLIASMRSCIRVQIN
jgi:hypothetical protein